MVRDRDMMMTMQHKQDSVCIMHDFTFIVSRTRAPHTRSACSILIVRTEPE